LLILSESYVLRNITEAHACRLPSGSTRIPVFDALVEKVRLFYSFKGATH
jgi:hypothetical protein